MPSLLLLEVDHTVCITLVVNLLVACVDATKVLFNLSEDMFRGLHI
jgi:hypothetical protein